MIQRIPITERPTMVVINLHLPDRFTEGLMRLMATWSQASLFPDFTGTSTDSDAPAAARNTRSAGTSRVARDEARVAEPLLVSQDFDVAYREHVIPLLESTNKISVIRGCNTAVKAFCEWYAQNDLRSYRPKVEDLENQPQLIAEFYRYCLTQGAENTAANKAKCLRKIWGEMQELGLISRDLPRSRMKQIRKRQGVDVAQHIPIPMSDEELSRCLMAIVELSDVLDYPRLGTLEPFQFWFNVFAACAVHGFRPADIWPLSREQGIGLTWDEVSWEPAPPIPGGERSRLNADWEFGYLSLRMNKTGRRLIAPQSPHMAFLIRQMAGLDKERVFPLPYANKAWYAALAKIFERAGFERVTTQRHGKDHREWPVSLCGGAPSASLRKTASVKWRQHGSLALSSMMLGHSVRAGSSRDVDDSSGHSAITEQHYSGGLIFSEAIAAYPRILASLPNPATC